MDDALKQDLLGMVERMPAFPQSVNKVIELTSDINCSPKQLVQIIEHDPVMTMKMLKLVNSPYFGLRSNISSINHALVYLGLNTVKNMALSIATVGMLKKFQSPWFNSDDFLLHSLLVATIARKLGESLPRDKHDPTDFFIAGLLHDFGKLVFVEFMKDKFHQALDMAHSKAVPLHEAETAIMSVSHADVGAMLGEFWGLPAELNMCILDHHHFQQEPNALTDCVFVANQVAKHLQLGNAGNPVIEDFPAHIQKQFGPLDMVLESLGDLSEETEKARVFMHL